MQIPNNYSINVARLETKADQVARYYHYCQIELGDCSEAEATEKFWDVYDRFPAEEFKVTLYHVVCHSEVFLER